MKRTGKGFVRRRYWQTDPDYCIESPEGHGWYPANHLRGFLRDHEDREVEVTIEANEAEPIGLRERVAKIFDEERGCCWVADYQLYAFRYHYLKDRVLAEINKEGQTK